MPLLHRAHHEPARPHIQPHRLAEYAALGGGAGAATHTLGAAMLRPLDPDHFPLAGAALAGLAGGAALNGACGLLAALAPSQLSRRQLHRVAGTTVLSASLGGLVGAAILRAAGGEPPPPGHLVVSGLVGGALLSVAVGGLRLASYVCCLCWPAWLQVDEPSDHESIFADDAEAQMGLVARLQQHFEPPDSPRSAGR